MKVKRILSTIAAVAVALCSFSLPAITGVSPPMAVTVSAAETDVNGITATKERVRRNESFDIVVNVPPAAETADTVEIRLSFDPEVFEVTSWNPSVSGGSSQKNYDNSKGFAILAAANSDVNLSGGLTFSATVRAKNSAPTGAHTFRLSRGDVSNTETGYSWQPETREVSVKVVDRIVSVSGSVYMTAQELPKNFDGTASVVMTDSIGKTSRVTVEMEPSDDGVTYEGFYMFSDAESEETYTIRTEVGGCTVRTETLKLEFSSVNMDMKMNIKGDVDGDGRIGASDATQILKFLVGSVSVIRDSQGILNEYLYDVACVDGGELSPRDATQILRHVAEFPSVFDNI